MKKVESGSGATDFGASMTPEEREGRPHIKEPRLNDWERERDFHAALKAEGVSVSIQEVAFPKLDREKIAHLIHAELVRHDVSIGKFTSIGFTPDWIDAAADSIIEEYG